MRAFLEQAKKEFDSFFGIVGHEPPVILLDSRKAMDAIWGRKTEKWLVGCVRNGAIYIFDPKVYSKVSDHKANEFFQTLKHEYCHIYFNQITRGGNPRWLNEGLACVLSGKKISYDKIPGNMFLEVFKYYERHGAEAYGISQFWVERLLRKFGRRKIAALIKNLAQVRNENAFGRAFKMHLGIPYTRAALKKLL